MFTTHFVSPSPTPLTAGYEPKSQLIMIILSHFSQDRT